MAVYAGRYSKDLQDRYGNGFRNATVAVQTLIGGVVTLYSDRAKTAYVPAEGLAANEVKADSKGNLRFFADPGNYQIVVTPAGGSALAAFPDSVFPDPLEPHASEGALAAEQEARENADIVLGLGDLASLRPQWVQVAADEPIVTVADLTYPTFQGPSVIRMDNKIEDALDRWYLYYSTDHNTAGGIALATAPDITGPWTDRGEVWLDTVAGSSTETPSVVWDEVNGLLNLYYQQNGVPSGQATILATSPDGQAFTRFGQMTFRSGSHWIGDGHTGHAVVFRDDSRWAAYHILAAGQFHMFGMSWSPDGRNWQTDPRYLYVSPDATGDDGTNQQVVWMVSQAFRWRGVWWWIGAVGGFALGTSQRNATIKMAPLAPDLRTILGPLKTVIDPADSAWQIGDIRQICVYADDDRLWLLWSDDAKVGAAYARF